MIEKNVSVIGLGHAFIHQEKVLKDNFKDIELCDIDQKKQIQYNAISDYKKLNNSLVFVLVPPKKHLEILKKLNNKKIILEKPMVTNLKELKELVNINNLDIYSSLHFAFGKEIEYFIKKINKRPNHIYSYISDNYVSNSHIKKNQISLGGSYLDEVINPLSAICRMFGYNIKFIKTEKKFYDGDIYDYYSKSVFKTDNIETIIEVEWNNKKSKKYIDLEYDDRTIRLDSMNQEVIDLTNNKILYKAKGNRMYNHYSGVIKDYKKNNNFKHSIILHKELLKGV